MEATVDDKDIARIIDAHRAIFPKVPQTDSAGHPAMAGGKPVTRDRTDEEVAHSLMDEIVKSLQGNVQRVEAEKAARAAAQEIKPIEITPK
jgi:hypothetical protein